VPRTEARVYASIWEDPEFLALPATAQRLYIFLTSQRDLTHCGVIPLRPTRWVPKAAGLTLGQVLEDLELLADPAAPFVIIDEDTGELFVRSLIRHDGVWKQPNIMKAARESAALIESPAILAALLAELRRIPAADHESAHVRRVHAEFLAEVRNRCGNPSAKASAIPSGKASPDPSQGEGDRHCPVPQVSPPPGSPSPSPLRRGRHAAPSPDQAPLLPVIALPSLKAEEGEEPNRGKDPLGELVAEIRAIREDWSTKSILRALADPSVAERPFEVVRAAMLAVARDPVSQHPGRLAHDGPWWSAAKVRPVPDTGPGWCGECDERTRMLETGPEGRPRYCPVCKPQAQVS